MTMMLTTMIMAMMVTLMLMMTTMIMVTMMMMIMMMMMMMMMMMLTMMMMIIVMMSMIMMLTMMMMIDGTILSTTLPIPKVMIIGSFCKYRRALYLYCFRPFVVRSYLELFCFLSFVSFVLRHLCSGTHRRNLIISSGWDECATEV